VFFTVPPETPWDLRFRLFGVDVRVHPFFWLLSVLLGWGAYEEGGGAVRGLVFLLAWTACVFVSILLHEFGHVFVGWYFGSKGHIVLYTFGGLAIGSNRLARRWQRVAVLIAGPGIQLLLWAALKGYFAAFPTHLPAVFEVAGGQEVDAFQVKVGFGFAVLQYLLVINLFWPILNLLPIFPLDGGQITREVCEGVSPRGGVAFSLGVSMVVAGFLGIYNLVASQKKIEALSWIPTGGIFMTLMFIMLAVGSFQALQAENQRRRSMWVDDDSLPWER
jgi:Zn-dependent protease